MCEEFVRNVVVSWCFDSFERLQGFGQFLWDERLCKFRDTRRKNVDYIYKIKILTKFFFKSTCALSKDSA